MRKNTIKLALAALILLGAGTWFFTSKNFPGNFSVNAPAYQDGEETQTISGAMEYLNTLKADLRTGRVDIDAVYNVYAQLDRSPRSKMGDWLQWEEMGPDDIGGRTRAIVIDKDNNKIIYAGGVSGGLWKTKNAGTTWSRIGGRDVENINVVSLVQTADGTLIYGTGEGGFTISNADGNSGFLGRGIFKSTDGGTTFTQVKSTNPAGANSPWLNVHRLKADPTNANRIYAGNDGGLYISDDAGQTWKKATIPSSFTKGKFILVSKDGQTVYVALANNNPGSSYQLFRSTDRGASFVRIGNEGAVKLPQSSSSYVLAMSPSNEKVIYVSIAKTNGSLEGVYRTEDGGDTWANIGTGGGIFNPLANQGQYDHCIVVDPKNQDRIVIGGLNLWEGKGINGRFQWTQLTNWSVERFGDNSINPYYVHADQHELIFDNSENPVLYIGSDGGVSKSIDFTYVDKPTFRNADFGYNTVQFYGIGVSAYNPDEVIGGTQDNGVLSVKNQGGGITLLNSDKIRGGDGGFSEISRINPNVYFGEYIYGEIYRSFTKGANWAQFFDGNVPPPGIEFRRYPFIAIFSLWESFNDPTSIDSVTFIDDDTDYKVGDEIAFKNPSGYTYRVKLTKNLDRGTPYTIQDVVQSRFYVGANDGIWFTRQALVSGITPEYFQLAKLPGFVPHDIKHSTDGNTVYVSGSTGVTGEVYRITGLSGKKFQYFDGVFNADSFGLKVSKIYTKQGQVATGVAVDEKDPNHVLITFGSYGGSDHIYRSYNALAETPTFTSISSNLPDFPLYDALISMEDKDDYLVAGEYGVWSSRNAGQTWKEENEGMERVPTFMLRQQKFGTQVWAKPVFYAATHGRGVFKTNTLVGFEDDEKSMKKAAIDVSVFPNPASDVANVKIALTKTSDVEIRIIDIQGRTVGRYNYSKQMAGERLFKLETANLTAGTYFVKVSTQGVIKTSKLLIMK